MGLLGKIEKGLLFIVSAPAGTGKTSIAEKLIERSQESIERCITCTTRAPRHNEKDGKDYYFFSREEFEKKVKEDAFLEHAKVYSNYYGTLKESIQKSLNAGKHVLLVIDTQGALTNKERGVIALYVFIAPPSMEALEERLRNRHSETPESIAKRLSWAENEMQQAKNYDKVIVNDNFDQAVIEFEEYIKQQEKELCKYIEEKND